MQMLGFQNGQMGGLCWSNVHREVRRKPDPPCEVCTGNGRVGQTQLTCKCSPKGNGQNGEMDSSHNQDNKNEVQRNQDRRTAADFYEE
ncbi:DnaJ/Hsp40 cysteine-rich domain superfamily protein [Prunus dulcis]|uniref:DnaJ/Hsp40 cysteine-rich domain superfamily protein n=1 Tax=Prunus dulcis TaxID=3755 RepID=A0A4Y1QZ98_PRUDU|nr:DnaJ/Hsp40 cysteine-rich domain superfamily protein [Prunus dulcis]